MILFIHSFIVTLKQPYTVQHGTEIEIRNNSPLLTAHKNIIKASHKRTRKLTLDVILNPEIYLEV